MKAIVYLVLILASVQLFAKVNSEAVLAEDAPGKSETLAAGQHKWLANLCYEVSTAGSKMKIVAPDADDSNAYKCGGESRVKAAVAAAYKEKMNLALGGTDPCVKVINDNGRLISSFSSSNPASVAAMKIVIAQLVKLGCPGY